MNSLSSFERSQQTSEKEYAEKIFDNRIWLTCEEAACYLRKSVGAIRVMVHRGQLRARKFRRRLYFKRSELDEILETSYYREVYNVS